MPASVNSGSEYTSSINRILENPELCAALNQRLKETLGGRQMRFMEVCGTHTVSIFQSGLKSILPDNVIHVSGPGCPVCVTHESEIKAFLQLAKVENVIIATFGDMLRVPDANGISLKHAKAGGAHVEIVYSPMEAVNIAIRHPEKEVVFLGIGFETTAPAVAAAIKMAAQNEIKNFSVFSMHKLVPPALRSLLLDGETQIDAFLLPGHVATITGLSPFEFLAREFAKPATVGGFEPADILLALNNLAEQLNTGPALTNSYARAVADGGNPRAIQIMRDVFEPDNGYWRGLGMIKDSGLSIRESFSKFDAIQRFGIKKDLAPHTGACQCGKILKGLLQPPQCPLFAKKCTPLNPAGPCMVSTEGSCAAYYKYGGP